MRRILNTIHSLFPKPLKRTAEKIYERLPFSLRYGKGYRQTLDFLLKSQYWTANQHEAYQLETFQKLLHHAVSHVPFYRRFYAGVNPQDIKSLEDIRILPLINKDHLRQFREEMKAENYPDSAFQYHTTGGSTAKPVGLYWQADRTVPMEKAFMKRQFGWIGYTLEHDRIVNIRGIPPSKGKLSEIVAGNQLRLSSYQMTPAVLDTYVELIQEFKPKVLQAYPSSALVLAKHLLEKRLRLPSIQIVLCGSEQFFPWHRKIIAEAFKCRIYSWYGQSEYVALAGECEHSTDYHFYSEYGVTEILKQNGEPVAPGETGEIVATGFLNFAFPLIRYRMEDLATLSRTPSCNCGRPYMRAERIDGRIQEMIVSKHENLISMTAINMHDEVFDSLHQFQFYQNRPGHLTLNIVPKLHHNENHEKKIIQALQSKLGGQFDITLNQVKHVQQTHRGKTRFLIQEIPLGEDWRSVKDD